MLKENLELGNCTYVETLWLLDSPPDEVRTSSLQLIASEDCESGLASQMAAFFDDIRADAVAQQGVVNEFHLPLMEPMASEGVDLSQALQDLLAKYHPEPVRHASLSLQGGPVVQHTLSIEAPSLTNIVTGLTKALPPCARSIVRSRHNALLFQV
jgi:hypothetical protein